MSDRSRLPLDWVRQRTGARSVEPGERIQSLWSGYGEILRLRLTGCATPTLVLKRVDPPTRSHHPRGWNTDRSHERKLASYAIERTFYETYARRCGPDARVPACVATQATDGGWWLLLEDLDAAGFAGRRHALEARELDACLAWLAAFHATFLGVAPEGLWEVGTYWHLATRPDELAAIRDPELRAAARLLDARLNACRFRTLVHGDAKVANFCFARDGRVAAVDFQYVGGGCGMKDVAYFLSSCLSDAACEATGPRHLDTYFAFLRRSLDARGSDVDVDALETEWRSLYPIAWADFVRFLAGWSPGHWKLNAHTDLVTRRVLDQLAPANRPRDSRSPTTDDGGRP